MLTNREGRSSEADIRNIEYAVETLRNLADVAKSSGCPMLEYLIGMAIEESNDILHKMQEPSVH